MALYLTPVSDDDLTAGERTFVKRIKRIYDDKEHTSFLYIQPRIGQLEPDFVLIDPYKGVLIVEVKDWSLDRIAEMNQREVRLSSGRRTRNPAFRCNQYLRNLCRLLSTDSSLVGSGGELSFPVFAKVFFPNISDDDFNTNDEVRSLLDQYPVKMLTSNSFRNCSPNDLFSDETQTISESHINRIRAKLFIEVTINADDNSIHAKAIDTPILDPGQERDYQKPLIGHFLSTGIPGSGKTKILLARAMFLAKKKPNWRILILTYNRSLARKLKQQIETHSLNDAAIKEEVKIKNELVLNSGIHRPLVEDAVSLTFKERSDEVGQLVKDRLLNDQSALEHSNEEEVDELRWIIDDLCQKVKDGNDETIIDEWFARSESNPLNHNIEVSTFHSFAKYLSGLDKPNDLSGTQLKEWWDATMPSAALENATPEYDAVLVDEYQDFHPDWFRLCKKVCRAHFDGRGKREESLWFAGDRLQSIYVERPQSWLDVGLNVKGRSTFIKKTYRASSSHIALAIKWLEHREDTRKEVRFFYKKEGYSPRQKALGEIEFATGEYEKLGSKIELLLREYRPEDILILCPKLTDANRIFDSLPEEVRDVSVITKEVGLGLGDKVILTTYHSSKGLESKVAVLADVDGVARLGYQGLTETMKRKLVYVGLTRASEKLLIHSNSEDGQYYQKLKSLFEEIS